MKSSLRHLLRTFATGLFAVLPLAATFLVILWIGSLLYALIGPDSLIGGLLVSLGLGVGSVWLSYLIGAGLVLLGVFGLGVLVEAGVQRGLSRAIASALQRIPLVRSIYDLSSRVVELMARREPSNKDGLRSMSPVWCHFGGPGGVAVLALLSTPQPLRLGDRLYHAVVVPTAPVPIGGGLLYVPQEWVVPAEVGVEALTSIYVSMGVTSAQHLGAAQGAVAPPPSAGTAGANL